MSTWTTVESATTWNNKRVRAGDRVRVSVDYYAGGKAGSKTHFAPGFEFEIKAISQVFDGAHGTRTYLRCEERCAPIPAKKCTKLAVAKGAT